MYHSFWPRFRVYPLHVLYHTTSFSIPSNVVSGTRVGYFLDVSHRFLPFPEFQDLILT